MAVSLNPIQYSMPYPKNLPDPDTCINDGYSLEIDGCYITADFWKLMDDGSIKWDGKKGLYDERGNLVRVATGNDGNHLGYSEFLLAYMGDENAEKFLRENGIDVVGGEGIYSPGFTFAGKDKLDYAFGLSLIGTNANYLSEHMNPNDVTSLAKGEFLLPGQRLMDFPESRFPVDGGGAGTHGHFEVSLFDDAKGWGFGNPLNFLNDPKWSSPSDFSGKYEWLDFDDDGSKIWTENSRRSWKDWEVWYGQY